MLIAKPFGLPQLTNTSGDQIKIEQNKTNETLTENNSQQLAFQLEKADIRDSAHNVSVYLNRTDDFFSRNQIPISALEQQQRLENITKNQSLVINDPPSLATSVASQLATTKFISFKKKFFSSFL